MKKKYLGLIFGGMILMLAPFSAKAATVAPFQRQLTPVVTLATPTPTPTIAPLLFKPVKEFKAIEFKYTNKRAELKNVKVTAKDATSITVDNEGVSVKVTVQTNTHFRRKFWGKSSLAEISVGDSVDIVGKWTSEAKTEIKAWVIRDLSIQKRFGVFFGTVKSFTDSGFVMTTIQRGEETVTLDSAKLIDRTGETITKSDIQVGHRVRVRGLWNSTSFTITEVTEVKNFSLPPFASPSP
jgi:hypothetical protein